LEAVRWLVDPILKQDPREVDLNGNPPLFWAIRHGNLEMAKLLNSPSMIRHTYLIEDTALHIAAINGEKETIKWLLKKGAEVGATNRQLETPSP
jgi:ankyrin repeat protein